MLSEPLPVSAPLQSNRVLEKAMKKVVDGILCDTENSTRIASREEAVGTTSVFGKTISLYRTVTHRFFLCEDDDDGPHMKLLKKTDAMDLYETFPTRDFDFDDAFDD